MTFENSDDVKGSDELIRLVHFTYQQIYVLGRYHVFYITRFYEIYEKIVTYLRYTCQLTLVWD